MAKYTPLEINEQVRGNASVIESTCTTQKKGSCFCGESIFHIPSPIVSYSMILDEKGWQRLPYAFDHQIYHEYWREKTNLVLKTIDFDNLVILGGSGVTGIGMINGFLDHDNFPMKRKVYIVTTSTISTITNKLKQWESYYPNNIIINDTPYDFYDEMDFYETPFPCNPNWDKKAWWWLENNIHKLTGQTLFWNIGA